jgi:hypothetical protein
MEGQVGWICRRIEGALAGAHCLKVSWFGTHALYEEAETSLHP